MTTLVLTVIGDDQPGLVDTLAGAVARHGGNWDRSSMTRLGTKFAGIVEVTVPAGRIDDLVSELDSLAGSGPLGITIERSGDAPTQVDASRGDVRWELHLIGQDRAGIVHEIARALARADVSFEELQTFTSSAPMSAETMFEATAVLVATGDVDLDALTAELEAIADELMVDLHLSSSPPDR